MSTTIDLAVVPHWINGAEYASNSGRTAPVCDPALGIETKRVALAIQVGMIGIRTTEYD